MMKFPMRTIVVKADKTVNFIAASLNPSRKWVQKQVQTFRLTHPMVQTTFAKGLRGLMRHRSEPISLHYVQFVLPALAGLLLCAFPARCQDSSERGIISRGDRAEVHVTARNTSG